MTSEALSNKKSNTQQAETKKNCIPAGTQVLVTGGTGFTGAVLVRKLIEQKLKVRVIARPSERTKKLVNLGCEVVEGQVYDDQVVANAVQGVEYIFHVAAAFREPGAGDEVYDLVHVKSTKLLAEAALKERSFKRFVHISTIGIHGHIDEPPANEEYRYAPGDIYQDTKLAGELWLRDFATINQLPFVVIRPAIIYGPGDRRLLKLFKLARQRIFPLLGNGKFLLHLTHVEDLTDSFILAAAHPAALNQVFICGDKESITLEQLVRVVAKESNNNIKFIKIPAAPFFVLAYLCEIICKPFGINPPLFRRRVAFFTKDRSFYTSKIHEVLGHHNKYSNQSGLIDTLRWYVHNKWLNITVISSELAPVLV